MVGSGGYAEKQPRFTERSGETDLSRIRSLEYDMDANDRAHFFIEEKFQKVESDINKRANEVRNLAEEKARIAKEYVDETVKATNAKVDRLTWAFAGACLTFSLAVIVGIVNVLTGKL